MPSTNEINARKTAEKADAFMKPSLTRWKPDYDRAVDLYAEAARLYRASGDYAAATIVEEKSAEASLLLTNYWDAGKTFERACESAVKKIPMDGAAVLALAERAAEAYASANRVQVGAEAMSRASRLVEDSDLFTSTALLRRSLEIFEEDEKDLYAGEHHRRLCAQLTRTGEYADAAEACLKYAESCSRAGQSNSLAKAYLSAIVALLYSGDGIGAQSTYADVCEIPDFEKSEERETAYKLLNAYRDADVEAIKSTVAQSSCLRFLDVAFTRLAAKLPNVAHDVARVAAEMGGQGKAGDTTDEDVDDDLC